MSPTTQERYERATAYVRRAIEEVEATPPTYNPVTKVIEWYAGQTKTEPVRNDLNRIEHRWMFARSDAERARVARDAELLADRTKENLPGAPSDWKRTNLFKGEKEKQTTATGYHKEVREQAHEVWRWVKDKSSGAADSARGIGKWLLIGGGVFLGWKALSHMRTRERRDSSRRALNTSIEKAARNAGWPTTMCPVCHRYKYTNSDGRLVPHEYPAGGICPGSRKAPLVISVGGDKSRKRKVSR